MIANKLLRIHQSGVWLGVEMLGEGDLPGTWKFRGRRIHYWDGREEPRLDCSQLAVLGPPKGGTRISDEVEVEFLLSKLVESQTMTPDALKALGEIEVWSGNTEE